MGVLRMLHQLFARDRAAPAPQLSPEVAQDLNRIRAERGQLHQELDRRLQAQTVMQARRRTLQRRSVDDHPTR